MSVRFLPGIDNNYPGLSGCLTSGWALSSSAATRGVSDLNESPRDEVAACAKLPLGPLRPALCPRLARLCRSVALTWL